MLLVFLLLLGLLLLLLLLYCAEVGDSRLAAALPQSAAGVRAIRRAPSSLSLRSRFGATVAVRQPQVGCGLLDKLSNVRGIRVVHPRCDIRVAHFSHLFSLPHRKWSNGPVCCASSGCGCFHSPAGLSRATTTALKVSCYRPSPSRPSACAHLDTIAPTALLLTSPRGLDCALQLLPASLCGKKVNCVIRRARSNLLCALLECTARRISFSCPVQRATHATWGPTSQ